MISDPFMRTALIYSAAAIAEIIGCFTFWSWLRLGKSPLWLLPGTAALIIFAVLLSYSPASASGRAYAAYGGIYILASLLWLWAVESITPDRYDILGGLLCLAGTVVILGVPRA